MEHLTKQQLILLAILISFVTSIATGIVTISLTEKSPEPITQTINRVVERTIERVVQEPVENQKASVATVIKETVVVKADDLIVEVVSKNKNRVVQVGFVKKVVDEETEKESEKLEIVGQGSIVFGGGKIITFGDGFENDESGKPVLVLKDGSRVDLSFVGKDEETGLVLLEAKDIDKLPKDSIKFADVDFGLNLGQTIVSIGYRATVTVEDGIVKSLPVKSVEDKNEKGEVVGEKKIVSSIETDIYGDVPYGSILLTLSGDLVGIKSLNEDKGVYAPVSKISSAINRITNSVKEVTVVK